MIPMQACSKLLIRPKVSLFLERQSDFSLQDIRCLLLLLCRACLMLLVSTQIHLSSLFNRQSRLLKSKSRILLLDLNQSHNLLTLHLPYSANLRLRSSLPLQQRILLLPSQPLLPPHLPPLRSQLQFTPPKILLQCFQLLLLKLQFMAQLLIWNKNLCTLNLQNPVFR